MNSLTLRWFGATLAVAVATAIEQPPVQVDINAAYPKKLSEYNFFIGNPYDLKPNDGVVPYDINTPLFSDYTVKHRFVWMPPGTSAQYDPDEAFSFPVGAVLIKSFGYLRDMRDPSKGEDILETRLLVHKADGWVGLPYVWNADKSDADLKVAGGEVHAEWTHSDGSKRSNNYILPNMNQCKGCHDVSGAIVPIGPKARHLNKSFAYDGGAENQLAHWSKIGYLNGAPEEAPRLPVWDDPATGTVAERARAYLDANCMHCHNPKGPADTSGLDLRYSQTDPRQWGVMKPPVAAGRGAGDNLFDIVPGKPDESILIFRLDSTDPGIMMPELPRRLVHEEAVALLREWIGSMPPLNQSSD
jgi:uncharacterized repeat protein (TIGR03806 family)